MHFKYFISYVEIDMLDSILFILEILVCSLIMYFYWAEGKEKLMK